MILVPPNPGFDPRKTSTGCFLWVNAKRGITTSSGNVTGWKDLSGSGHDMAPITSNPAYNATGMNGVYPCVTFDGSTNDMCRIGLGGSTRSSFSFWGVVQPLTFATFNALWYAPSSGSWLLVNNTNFYFEDGAANQSLDYWVNNVGAKAGTLGSSFKTNTTYEICGTYDGTTLKIYIDNVLLGSQAVSGLIIGDRVSLGGLKPGYSGSQWNGKISEFAMFPGVLSATDRTNLHNYAQYHWFPLWQKNTGSWLFDNTLNSCPISAAGVWSYDYTQPLTISAWICPDSGQTDKISVIGYEQTGGAFRGFDFLRELNGKLSFYQCGTYSSSCLYAFSTASTVGANGSSWTHVAVTTDGSGTAAGIKFYVNGQSAGPTTSTNDNLTTTILDNSLPFYLGDSYGTTRWPGKMQNVSVFTAALSAGSITTLYNNGLPADLTGMSNLAHWWYMGFGGDTPTTVRDQVGSWHLTAPAGALTPVTPLPLS